MKDGSGLALRNKSYPLGVAECSHCGGMLLLKAKKNKRLYLRPYNPNIGGGIIRAIEDLAHNPATGGQPLPDIPDSIKSIPIIGSLAQLLY